MQGVKILRTKVTFFPSQTDMKVIMWYITSCIVFMNKYCRAFYRLFLYDQATQELT